MQEISLLPRVAVGAVIVQNDEVLLVKRKEPPDQNRWAIPGGKVKWGEKLVQALKREIKEETQLDIDVQKLLKIIESFTTDSQGKLTYHYIILDYLAKIENGKARAGDDALDIRWFGKEDLRRFPVTETTRALLKEEFGF